MDEKDYKFYTSGKKYFYYWIKKTVKYNDLPGFEKQETLFKIEKTELMTGLPPLNIFKLSSNPERYPPVTGKRIITGFEIYQAMLFSAFRTFETMDGLQFNDIGVMVPRVPMPREVPPPTEKEISKQKEDREKLSEELKFFKGIEDDEKIIANIRKLVAENSGGNWFELKVTQDAIDFAMNFKIDIISLFTTRKFILKLSSGFRLTSSNPDFIKEKIERPEPVIINKEELRSQIELAFANGDLGFLLRNLSLGRKNLKDASGIALMKNVSIFIKGNELGINELKEQEERAATEAATEARIKRVEPKRNMDMYSGGIVELDEDLLMVEDND